MSTFTLSTLDQAAEQTYIRYALTFACGNDDTATTVKNLQTAIKSLVNEVPMLAGTVTTNDQQKLAVTVTLQQIKNFTPTIAHLESPHDNYVTICQSGIAPASIMGEDFTPLSDKPDPETSPACAIQANFLQGGLILVIYLHHAVADIRGISTILRLMSEGMTIRLLDQETLDHDAATASQARSRLSHGTGAPAFLQDTTFAGRRTNTTPRLEPAPNRAAIFGFKLNVIQQTTELINARRRLQAGISDLSRADMVTPRDVLVAIVWRAYVRARWPVGGEGDENSTSVSFPVDLRSYLVPPLETYWMGNAEITAVANEDILRLGTSYDLSSLERTAAIIHSTAKAAASDLLVRSRINLLNEDPNPQDLQPAQLVVHDWTPVPKMGEQEMDLGLGLGRPDAIRRTGRGFGRREVVLLPENPQTQTWEVQMELEHFWMTNILRDDLLRAFLWGVAT
ncbi:hypothetical protein Q7P37_007172 [Cladosporium fusiforme]